MILQLKSAATPIPSESPGCNCSSRLPTWPIHVRLRPTGTKVLGHPPSSRTSAAHRHQRSRIPAWFASVCGPQAQDGPSPTTNGDCEPHPRGPEDDHPYLRGKRRAEYSTEGGGRVRVGKPTSPGVPGARQGVVGVPSGACGARWARPAPGPARTDHIKTDEGQAIRRVSPRPDMPCGRSRRSATPGRCSAGRSCRPRAHSRSQPATTPPAHSAPQAGSSRPPSAAP